MLENIHMKEKEVFFVWKIVRLFETWFEKLKCWTNEKMVLKQENGNHKIIRNESFSSS